MNNYAMRLITNKNRMRNTRGYDNYDRASRGNYELRGDFESYDGRRGVKGTGRYGIGGSRYYPRSDRAMKPYYDEDYAYDSLHDYDEYDEYENDKRRSYMPTNWGYNSSDYASGEMRLSKRDMQEWKRNLENADGSMGEHFRDMQQVLSVAQQQGVQFRDYDEKDFCLVVNMLYSDYCEALKPIVSPDKELLVYVRMAKAWLEDEDATRGKEKLYLYYKCVVDDDYE